MACFAACMMSRFTINMQFLALQARVSLSSAVNLFHPVSQNGFLLEDFPKAFSAPLKKHKPKKVSKVNVHSSSLTLPRRFVEDIVDL